MIIDCIADLHGNYPELQGGDLLIVAGDLTARDTEKDIDDFVKWIMSYFHMYQKAIVIAGNHDNQASIGKHKLFTGCQEYNWLTYLCDSGISFEGLLIWGSPWTPWFKGVNPRCKAFMRKDRLLSTKWEKIPLKTDILITHGPAFGVLDGIPIGDGSLYHAGSSSLYSWLEYVERPRYHIFGHIHEAYGIEEHFPTYNGKMMQSINCSHVDEHYEPVNKPIRIIL
jgi:Icc-related predicted phosphoesterase